MEPFAHYHLQATVPNTTNLTQQLATTHIKENAAATHHHINNNNNSNNNNAMKNSSSNKGMSMRELEEEYERESVEDDRTVMTDIEAFEQNLKKLAGKVT